MTTISTSLDFQKVCIRLSSQICIPGIRISSRRDLLRMLDNLETEIHNLSKFEVTLRQNPSTSNKATFDRKLAQIQADIEHLEQLITFATLLG